ncbi:hypothetical protein HLH34_11095 [Gluconacetobacter azotocaptans]|uniref:Glycosyltransferase RgtA/B/C/D-like domain-containing protein n=1 Tax=Gluconacetobacter azotocaptans TaxID=142834 RepID=A0A7W4JTB1_9PROT|nr:hypothetical protein [Gluconacetobacter azotocaptans]MBB2190502.1 hypothetical protein [Gluconacetobacter azotocaptans]MBM9402338.1 hypothetical protein [Gluconacetobacter azotocaptans]GBQ28507.1 hypothetical protein AA13594_1013 [Gluconacetobacter azotocaptans DSM 13594]
MPATRQPPAPLPAPKTTRNLSPILVVSGALLAYAIVLFHPALLNDGDSFWHIAAGNWILHHRAVPHADPFSATFAQHPWVAHEWLSELLMAAAFDVARWDGVLVLTGLAFALTCGMVAAFVARRAGGLAAIVTTMLAMACTFPSLLARPHLLALPCLAAWTIALLRARESGTAPPPLSVLTVMLLWANLHGSFAFGLALAIPFAIEAVIDSRTDPEADPIPTALHWGRFILLSTATSLVTPNGRQGLLFPFRLVRMPQLAGIGEWQPMHFATIQPLEYALFAILYVSMTRTVRVPAIRLLVLMGLLYLALRHERDQMVAGVVGALILARPLGRAVTHDSTTSAVPRAARPCLFAGTIAFALLTMGRTFHPFVLRDRQSAPVSALLHVPADLARQPVFNSYAFGGYLIFSGIRPFIDGRADMYGAAFMTAYQAAMDMSDRDAFARIVARHGIRWTILPPGAPLVGLLDTLPGWRRMYADKIAVIHVHAEAAPLPGAAP